MRVPGQGRKLKGNSEQIQSVAKKDGSRASIDFLVFREISINILGIYKMFLRVMCTVHG